MRTMTVPTFYLETSVWGSLAPRQPRDRKGVVNRLLRLLDGAKGICVISEVVLEEIEEAPHSRNVLLFQAIERIGPLMLAVTLEARALARAYIDAGILPERRRSDALHVAIATCFDCDFLVSWNHRHMTRPTLGRLYEDVNRLQAFPRSPLICNPVEACDELRSG